jgi:hypothetical protein
MLAVRTCHTQARSCKAQKISKKPDQHIWMCWARIHRYIPLVRKVTTDGLASSLAATGDVTITPSIGAMPILHFNYGALKHLTTCSCINISSAPWLHNPIAQDIAGESHMIAVSHSLLDSDASEPSLFGQRSLAQFKWSETCRNQPPSFSSCEVTSAATDRSPDEHTKH